MRRSILLQQPCKGVILGTIRSQITELIGYAIRAHLISLAKWNKGYENQGCYYSYRQQSELEVVRDRHQLVQMSNVEKGVDDEQEDKCRYVAAAEVAGILQREELDCAATTSSI